MNDIDKQRQNLQAAMNMHSAGLISSEHFAKMLGLNLKDLNNGTLSEQRNMDFAGWAAYKKRIGKRIISAVMPSVLFFSAMVLTLIIRHIYLHK